MIWFAIVESHGMTMRDQLSKTEFAELVEFLELHFDQGGMDVFMLDGYLCALACGPNRLDPADWLSLVWGDDGDEPRAQSIAKLPHIIALLLRYSNFIQGVLRERLYEPLVPEQPLPQMDSRAQTWCLGFLIGVSLDATWEKLFAREVSAVIAIPILALADPRQFFEESEPDPELLETFITSLPVAIASIRLYWLTEQTPTRRGRALPSRKARAAKATAATASAQPIVSGPQTIHRVKIRLLDVKPSIWRRVEIPSQTPLPEVSQILLAAMGWNDSHLHAFRANGRSYATPDPEFLGDDEDERRVTLAQLAPRPKDQFSFDYDFGDGWEHRVTVEAITLAQPGAIYPCCLAGARACPPEDCGGPWGYAELLRTLGDPTDDEHEEMLAWAGSLDPEAFSVDAVNVDLAAYAPRDRRQIKTMSTAKKTSTVKKKSRTADPV